MPRLAEIDLPELVAARLTALAEAKQALPADLVLQALQGLTDSPKTRRAILAHRRGRSLADLGWLDDAEGQSVDDILALADSESAFTLLSALEELIEKTWSKTPGARTGTQNILVSVMALMREVNNGGFDQFFRNSSKSWAFFAPDACLHIGRKDAAKLARRAIRAVKVPEGPNPFELLDESMNRPSQRRDDVLNECDLAFHQLTGLEESLLAYARKHRGGLPE